MTATSVHAEQRGQAPGAAQDILGWLLVMPLLDRREIELLAEWSPTTVSQTIKGLAAKRLVSSVPSPVPSVPTVRRFYLTADGLAAVAEARGTNANVLLRRHPVSAHHISLLLSRLETVTAVYRTTSLLASETGIRGFRWYRKHPLDAVVEIDGGKVIGIIREGRSAPPAHLTRRMWSLLRGRHPDTVLLLVPDALRLRDWHRSLERSRLTVLLALEQDVLTAGPEEHIWYVPSAREPWPLRQVLPLVKGGTVPTEPPPVRLFSPKRDLEAAACCWLEGGADLLEGEHYLPLVLQGATRHLITTLGLWPWVTMADLEGISGLTKARLLQLLDIPLRLGLVWRVRHDGRVRHVLADRGLRLLARADRLAIPTVLARWSPSPRRRGGPSLWSDVRGSRARKLATDIHHTVAVHRFVAAVASQVRDQEGSVVLLDPAHRASRRYQIDGKQAAVNPDAYGQVEFHGQTRHFFLEWERRAAHPALLLKKLDPYRRYYASRQPLEDCGDYPTLLVVLRDEIVESHFLRIAKEELNRADAPPLRVLATSAGLVEARGPLSRVWQELPGGDRRLLW